MDVSKSSDSLLEEENLLTPKTPVRITFRRFSIEVSVPYSKKPQRNATNKVEITKIIPLYFHSEVSKLWQYWLWSFQAGCTKLERFLHKNQRTQRKLLNFESCVVGMSKEKLFDM